MVPMHIFQILNHYTAPQDLDPGFAVLDNSANERPDWYEYWPIRKFLLNEALDEDVFLLVRNLRKLLNLQIRIGGRVGWRRVRPTLLALKSYWRGYPRPED